MLARSRLGARAARWSVMLVLAGCGDATPPAPATPKAADAPAATPDAKAPVVAPTPAPVEPAPAPEVTTAPTGEDWLVWYSQGGQWVTRWIDAGPSESKLVAERHALVLSDGTRLWRVERKDGELDVMSCDCLDEDADEGSKPDCKPLARLTTPGLQATELVTEASLTIRAASTESELGDGLERSLDIAGGSGSRLFYTWSESGYMCGAHGMIEGGEQVFDLAAGKAVEDPFAAIDRALPKEVREPAGAEIHGLLDECEGGDGPSLREVLDEKMGLTDLAVALRDGKPQLSWGFEAETYYACSPDYVSHGSGSSELLPAAAPLGLDGPLPKGVEHALAQIGSAPVVGWARLSLSAAARPAALAAFRVADETPWPATFTSERPIAVPATQAHREAKAKLDEGRRLTRAGDHATAIATYDAAIALDPTLARAWSERGYAKLLSGDLDGAKADLEAALPLDEGAPYKAAVHYNLGLVAQKSGDVEAARKAFEASLALRDNEAVRKALAGLK